MSEPERRRRRPAVSCTLCRKRKIRCNKENPCSNCVRSRNAACIYEGLPSHQPPRRAPKQGAPSEDDRSQDGFSTGYREANILLPSGRASSASGTIGTPSLFSRSIGPYSTAASTPASQDSVRELDQMKVKIKQLEEQLSKKDTPVYNTISTASAVQASSSIFGSFSYHTGGNLMCKCETIGQAMMHKTRLASQSHWSNGILHFKDTFELIEPLVKDERPRAFYGIQRCKNLAKVIKARRAPSWPLVTNSSLPQKAIADELVDCYLRTSESTYRVLHIPSFRKDYEALWTTDSEPNPTFLILLKLVLAIGSVVYDQKFSLRASAVQWIYEGQLWSCEPSFKARLSIQALQINILLLRAREVCAVGGELIFLAAGSLMRTAVYMGLHRDPLRLPKRTTLATELRRRLWNTVLEISLQASLMLGTPPMLSLDESDTEPPRNFDDDQLVAEDAVPKPDIELTQSSIPIALHQTFPVRLAIVRLLNGVGMQNRYEEILRLDTELRQAYQSVRRTLHRNQLGASQPPDRFDIRVVDFILNRYLLALHIPLFGTSLSEAAYAYSRKVVVETSIKLWCTAYPASPIASPIAANDTTCHDDTDFARLATCAYGLFRLAALQASCIILLELRTQLQEENSLGPMPLRRDLMSVLEDAKAWNWQCIETGETNVKGYLLISLIVAQIDAIMKGLDKTETGKALLKAVEAAEDRCLPTLEERAAQGQADGPVDSFNHMSLNSTPMDLVEDWDFLMPGEQSGFGNFSFMNWDFNDDNIQEPSLW